jgi:hypothetical protein
MEFDEVLSSFHHITKNMTEDLAAIPRLAYSMSYLEFIHESYPCNM